ncbi:hypothetical protein [Pontibacter ramchanderi]|uniref:Lipoprotein n=1 Tax=Pontibacter ramchanderi TaxID=1179743 RepID=A0A2N3U7N5_9BACT|nr:hypothetical protein [Pontibacter ramchanderi]PKV62762.1 hypothetical protein BD749_3647 [Pontibacter ramchanderi]
MALKQIITYSLIFFLSLALLGCNKHEIEPDTPQNTSGVYAAGYEENIKGISVAKYWKDGIATALTDGTHGANATSIFVVGNDVYVAGNEATAERKYVAKYWKNGNEINLTAGANMAFIHSIYVKQ